MYRHSRRSFRSRFRGTSLFEGFTVIAIVLLLGSALYQGFSFDDSIAIRAAEAHGFAYPVVVNKSYFATWQCSKGDNVVYTVQAISPRNRSETILVCAGFMKGATVRIP